MLYILIIVGCVIGIVLGAIMPVIPYTYSIYLSVAILSILDSILGAIVAMLKQEFDFKVFITGFFGNILLTIGLVFLGQKLNLDIYLAVIIVYVGRMFNDLTFIRRYFVDKWYTRYSKIKTDFIDKTTEDEYKELEKSLPKNDEFENYQIDYKVVKTHSDQ